MESYHHRQETPNKDTNFEDLCSNRKLFPFQR